MSVDPARGRVFDAIADTYARVRPGYPDALFDALTADARLGPGSRALEIGCGPGIATAALLERGLTVLAIEPGDAMAAAARDRHNADAFEVVVSTFEDWPVEPRAFDLVLAATSIHWVRADVRWAKSAAALRPGGSLALLTNVTIAGATFNDLYAATSDLHARYVGPDDTQSATPDEMEAAIDATRADIGLLWGEIEPYGGSVPAAAFFAPPTVHTVVWDRDFSTDDAIALLSTFSTYLVIEPGDRAELFARLREVIDRDFGGRVTRRYLAVLAVAPVLA